MPEDIKDKDLNLNPEEEEEEGKPSEGGEGGEGEEEAPESIKVGDEEFTSDQLKEHLKKSKSYDDLLPDYTRKSQKLAKIEEKGLEERPEEPKEEDPPYYDPNWVPKSYKELAEALKTAEARGEKMAMKKLEQVNLNQQNAEKQLDGFLEDVKSKDAEFDGQDFIDYIYQHKLRVQTIDDLKAIYSAYKEVVIAGATKGGKGKERTDSVSPPGGGKGKPYTVPMKDIRGGGSSLEVVLDEFHKLKGK